MPELPNGALQLPPATARPGGEPGERASGGSRIDPKGVRSFRRATALLAAAIGLGFLVKVLFGL